MSCFSHHHTKESRNINKFLRDHRNERRNKVLILGAGETGKSTFLKQILLCHGVSEGEILKMRQKTKIAAISCVFQGLQILCRILTTESDFKQILEVKETALFVDILLGASTQALEQRELDAMKHLCKCEAVRPVIALKRDVLASNFEFFMNKLESLLDENYVVTDEDMLRVRIVTTGVCHYDIMIDSVMWEFIDVGGQRTERRKWLHLFDDITSLVFLTSLDFFNKSLEEDPNENRLNEDVNLFKEMIHHPSLPSFWIFFQNKVDVLREQIQDGSFHKWCPQAPTDLEGAIMWHRKKFLVNIPHEKNVSFHVTCALDTKNMKTIIKLVREEILRERLSVVGI
eukprot:TRINITY_DN3150_c0_g3_i2.p1 TRINITY_DN3150_c0_g3~~TRINITY_DN3150_c0_g3_i2.p1  ORF type:complete len:343 (+),score=59.26 TRINITY_DN3150_c0_g3_i2:60-1088(+)